MAKHVIKLKSFEFLSLIIILLNSLSYSLANNDSKEYTKYLSLLVGAENFFLFFYSSEMALKMLGLGIIMKKNAYFRDGWNILDFIVVLALFLSFAGFQDLDLSLFRLLRLLRPLKTAAQFIELRIILYALFSALPLLFISFAILNFFYAVYSIAGLQVFSGILKQRCISVESGLFLAEEMVCGYVECPIDYFCGKSIANPYENIINYDTLHSSYMQTLLTVTLDNWTTIMYFILKAYSNYAWVYFVSLVIVGNYFMMNLLLAIIKVKFSESHIFLKGENNHKNIEGEKQKENQSFDLNELKREGLWEGRGFMKKIHENRNRILKKNKNF